MSIHASHLTSECFRTASDHTKSSWVASVSIDGSHSLRSAFQSNTGVQVTGAYISKHPLVTAKRYYSWIILIVVPDWGESTNENIGCPRHTKNA